MATLDLGRVIPLERGDWASGTTYEFMDSVQYEGSTYVSIYSGSHTASSANRPTTTLGQSTYWRRNAAGFDPKGAWDSTTAYERDNLVEYGGTVFRCTANTTAGIDPSNGNYWEAFALGIGEYLGEWNSTDTYAEGAIVIWDVDSGNNINGLFRANQAVPANTNPGDNPSYWDVLAAGFVWQGAWQTGRVYRWRSVISYRGCLYLAPNKSGAPADENPTSLNNWTRLTEGFNYVGTLESLGSSTSLYFGDVVTFANGLYQVIQSTNGADDPRLTPANFRVLTKWWDWQGLWNNSTVYYLDQVVIYQNSIYRVLGTTTTGQNPDNASSLFQTVIEAPDNFTDYNSSTKRLQIRRVTQATNDAATYANGEPVAITDGSGNATGVLYIHDGATQGGKPSPDPQTLVPTGAVNAFAMSTVPTGWLECNGAAISRTTYSDLFSAIGETYGSGDSSTTFNLPDLRGEFIRGWDNGRGRDNNGSRVFGSAQDDQLKTHRHGVSVGRLYTYCGNCYHMANTITVTDPHTLSTTVESRPKNVAMKYCIKY